jgi:hypothetical protein
MANRKRSAVLPERRRSETGWAGPGGGMKVLRPEQPSARMLRDRVMEAEALLEQGCRSVGASQIASGAYTDWHRILAPQTQAPQRGSRDIHGFAGKAPAFVSPYDCIEPPGTTPAVVDTV